jgi:pyruvate dehydrogenase E2 component (dihydrolipoamide acetyltransferase)
MLHEYKLPSLGDGVTGKVTEILIKPGDKVSKDQIVIVVGTDKVDAEMPVDAEGVVSEVLVKKGDEVREGTLVLRLEATNGADAASVAPAAVAPAKDPVSVPDAGVSETVFKLPSLGEGVTGKILEVMVKPGDTVSKDQIVLVVGTDKVDAEIPSDVSGTVSEVLVQKGQDITEGAAVMRLTGGAKNVAPAAVAPPSAPAATSAAPPAPVAAIASSNNVRSAQLRVSPLARKRAKELNINLTDVQVEEGATRISYKDVLAFVKGKMESGRGAAGGGLAPAHKKLPNFEKFGKTERKALSRIGVLTAENMTYAFNAIPHAWIMEKVDITRLEQLRQQYKETVKTSGGNLTTTAIIAKAVTVILKKMPQFNASLDAETNEVIYKDFYNIGIAVDTPRGLLVPVLRHCDQKSLTEISKDLTELSTRTRDGKNKPDDLDGGTFTISNIGGIGGTGMISIVNWPQVAILSVTAAQMEPHWNDSTFEPRLMMPITIGWDHRVINGADAARFLVELKKILEEPFAAWL